MNPENRIEIQEAPRLKRFVMISLGLHITVMIIQGLAPEKARTPKSLPPIKVAYVPPEKAPTFVDAPKPKKEETPKTSEMISRYDSRAHSNRSNRKSHTYQNKKTIVPKVSASKSQPSKSQFVPKKETLPDPAPLKKPYRPAERGFILPKPKGEPTPRPSPKTITGGTMALLEGFDPEKYAALDTHSETEEDDDEAISLDTRESKYASYFARIKHQIERVWTYPDEAAKRGVSGRLTLRFQISKDGNLMNVSLVDRSGYNILDEAALQAVKTAAPYYPFPVTIDRDKLSILATFIYTPSVNSQYFVPR